jgi:ATP-dependent Clp protease ATP-binding subunit ClpX
MKARPGSSRGPDREARCSFCRKDREEAKLLISGQSGFICRACATASHRLLHGDIDCRYPAWLGRTPAEIKTALDAAVVGQEHAKRTLAVALYNHHKRLAHQRRHGAEIAKSNVLMIGPSGTGKTLLARTLAGIAEVPFVIADATTLTEAGYVGADVESILFRLLQVADYDIEEVQAGIVYIDEIDKIARKTSPHAGGRDIAGEGVQQALLRILEGAPVLVPADGGRRYGRGSDLEIDTANILFIAGGTFAGLEEIVLTREEPAAMGYGGALPQAAGSLGEVVKRVCPEDLVAFGLLPEFVGRFPVTTALDALDESDLLNVLTRPRDALVKQYKLLFRMSGIDLQFEEAALRAIVRKAVERSSGARGLRAIMEQLLLDLMFALPERPEIRKVIVDREAVAPGGAHLLLASDRHFGDASPLPPGRFRREAHKPAGGALPSIRWGS